MSFLLENHDEIGLVVLGLSIGSLISAILTRNSILYLLFGISFIVASTLIDIRG